MYAPSPSPARRSRAAFSLQRFFEISVLTAALAALTITAVSAQTVFSGAGTASATAQLNAFQNAIGGINNGAGGGPQASGFRRINWDGVAVPAAGSDTPINSTTVGITQDKFLARGALYSEITAISSDGFATVNPSGGASNFTAFTPSRISAAINGNVITQSFTLPGSLTGAASRGFGAIFLDVELANTSKIEYFNGAASLGSFFVPISGNGQASFLGVLFDNPQITSIALTLGNASLFNFSNGVVTQGSAEVLTGGSAARDLVAVDDFVYAEPQSIGSTAAPEPGSIALLALGLIAPVSLRLRRNYRHLSTPSERKI